MEINSMVTEDYEVDQVQDADKDVSLELFAEVEVCA
jgi:hypothetical protein